MFISFCLFLFRPLSRKLSDISSILDSKSVSEALKKGQEPIGLLESDENNTVANGNILTLVMLNKLRCQAHFYLSANQIT